MASVYREFEIGVSPDEAWKALRDVGRINQLITFLGEVSVEGDVRTCSLGDQGELNELIVSVDDERRRLAYSVLESPFGFEHHNASMQVDANGNGGSRFTWITDVKPDAAVPALSEALDAAVESIRHTLK